jgi:hypothetical protein
MAKSLLSPDSVSQSQFERKEVLHKNHYFDNEIVERLMYRYLEGACTDVALRDEIMVHASELIRQIIKAHNLGQICPGKDDTTGGDLFQTAWIQIESALYKYQARPYCSKCYNALRPRESLIIDEFWFIDEVAKKIKRCPRCETALTAKTIYYKGESKVFNLWSQIARTVALAYIKKENRDRKNSGVFQEHLEQRTEPKSDILGLFFQEAHEICKYNKDHLKVLKTIEDLYKEDEKPYDGLIGKLVERSGLPRTTITGFLKVLRLRAKDFTNSPINEQNDSKQKFTEQEEDDWS